MCAHTPARRSGQQEGEAVCSRAPGEVALLLGGGLPPCRSSAPVPAVARGVRPSLVPPAPLQDRSCPGGRLSADGRPPRRGRCGPRRGCSRGGGRSPAAGSPRAALGAPCACAQRVATSTALACLRRTAAPFARPAVEWRILLGSTGGRKPILPPRPRGRTAETKAAPALRRQEPGAGPPGPWATGDPRRPRATAAAQPA